MGSISLADAYPGSAEGSLHPGLPPAPLQPSSPAGPWPTSSPQTPPSPMKHSHRLVPTQGPGSARPIRVWLAQKHPSSEKTFVFSPAHKPGDLHWAIPSETKASSPSKVNIIPCQGHQTHTQATDFYKILNSNLSRTLRRAALGPPTRLPSLATALTANLVSAQQLAEMPSCFSAQVPRQARIAEDQGRLEQAWALEQGAVEGSPAWAENSKNRWGHWVRFSCCCEGCICKALTAKTAAHQSSGQSLDLPPQSQFIFITILPVGITLSFIDQRCPKPYLQEVTP